MNYWFRSSWGVAAGFCDPWGVAAGFCGPVCVIKPIVCAMVGLAASPSGLLCVLFLNENGIMFGN